MKNVLKLIDYAQRVPELLDGVDDSTDGSVADLVISAFVQTLERLVRRGLRRDYRDHADDLAVLRGRLDLAQQIRRHHAARPTLSCRYEEHTLDTPFNAVLRYAASLAWTDWPELRRRLPVIRSWLQEIPLRPFGSEEIDRFRYNRLTEYYEPAHRLCRLVIDGAGVMLEEGNAAPAGSFIVDMNRVFEDFVGRWLTENVRAPFRAVLQSRHKLDAQGAIEIKPDVLIYRGSRIVGVIDAKYKLRSSGGVPGNQDAYQVLAYARRFGVRRAWLLFADDDTKARAATMMDGENTVMSVGVGLSAEWNRIVEVLTRLRDDVCSERS